MESKDHRHDTNVKKVDRLSPTRVRLTIEMSQETVSKHENSTTQAYLRQARLPGFRPGKAPINIVKQKFKDEIRRDVVSHLLEAGIGDALHSTQLNPLNRPSIEIKPIDFDKGGPLEFSAEFEVRPDIELKSYKGIFLKRSDLDPTPEEVTKTLDNLRERFSTLEPTDQKKVEKGQFGVVELAYELVGEPKISEPKKQYTFEIGVGGLIADVDNAILAMTVGEEKAVMAKFPDNYSEKSHAGREANFEIKLLEVKKKILPELNDEFAKQMRENGTLASLQEEVTKTISDNKKKNSDKAQREQILNHLVEKNAFEVPGSLVERQAHSLIEGIQQDMRQQGYPAPKLTDEDLKNVRTRAEHLVRGSLLLHEVSKKEKIALDESRFQSRLKEIADRFQRPTEETEKMLDGKGMTERIKDDVLTDQVFEFLIQNAVIGK
ncbi:MAG: trigger factor [Deltaproteobacteria bacterium]|nr:trigger factor [Deltaproteobacteria bacterium]MBI3294125.1 trigger factor [Deltaproteobacteria bacterium]